MFFCLINDLKFYKYYQYHDILITSELFWVLFIQGVQAYTNGSSKLGLKGKSLPK